MANMILVNYYVRLIKKDMYDLENVPADIKDLVQKLLNNESIEINDEKEISTEDIVNNEELKEDIKYGAKTLDNKSIYIPLNDIKETTLAAIKIEDIINKELFEIIPEDIKFELIRIENVFGRLDSMEDVLLQYDEEKLDITLKCKLKEDVVSYQEFLRIDIRLLSSNYENMMFTIYFITK